VFPRVSLTVKICPECPARMATAMKFPEVLLALNASDAELVVPASLLVCCTSLIGVGAARTVKSTPLLACPPTVTTTLPVAAPAGTGTTMLGSFQLVGVAVVPLNVTVLVPCGAPKFVPVIVTDVPTGPKVGFKLVMLGGVTIAKFKILLNSPLTMT